MPDVSAGFFRYASKTLYKYALKGTQMKVLLADQKSNIRYGLMVLLGEQPDLKIMGDTDNADDLLHQIKKDCPDLLLLGWGLPGMSMNELFTKICHLCPQIHIIVLSERAYLRETILSAGADGFMCKGDPPEKLLALVQKAQTFKAQEMSTNCSAEIRYPSDIEIH
jgi:DNA-binding NarL/FixJ family response regulator